MVGIIWEQPPQDAAKGRANRQAILSGVVERPYEWARLGVWSKKSTAQQAASDIRCGKAIESNGGDYEAQWSEVTPGQWAVWVRWIPTLSQAD